MFLDSVCLSICICLSVSLSYTHEQWHTHTAINTHARTNPSVCVNLFHARAPNLPLVTMERSGNHILRAFCASFPHESEKKNWLCCDGVKREYCVMKVLKKRTKKTNHEFKKTKQIWKRGREKKKVFGTCFMRTYKKEEIFYFTQWWKKYICATKREKEREVKRKGKWNRRSSSFPSSETVSNPASKPRRTKHSSSECFVKGKDKGRPSRRDRAF